MWRVTKAACGDSSVWQQRAGPATVWLMLYLRSSSAATTAIDIRLRMPSSRSRACAAPGNRSAMHWAQRSRPRRMKRPNSPAVMKPELSWSRARHTSCSCMSDTWVSGMCKWIRAILCSSSYIMRPEPSSSISLKNLYQRQVAVMPPCPA